MCLIEAVPYISNISGTYGAYFKKWDKRSLNTLKLEYLNLTNNKRENQVYNEDANSLIKKIVVIFFLLFMILSTKSFSFIE